MIESPTITQLFEMAPVATVVLLIAGIGFWAALRVSKRHIESLERMIEYLKKK